MGQVKGMCFALITFDVVFSRSYIKLLVIGFFGFFLSLSEAQSQCPQAKGAPLSQRTANYQISCRLDTALKAAICTQKIIWVNPSPDTIQEMSFYMYMNAFKHTRSTFLKDVGGSVFGESFLDRKAEEWGYIEISEIIEGGVNRKSELNYISPDDGRPEDESLISYPLAQPAMPGDTITLEMAFVSKLPKLLVRSGYSRDHFYHFTHWFPQVTVYEQDSAGTWYWNHHQFHRSTEFFSDFGTYEVDVTVPENLTVGGSGCMEVSQPKDGWKTYSFDAHDVIDFAWVAYPHFSVTEDSYNGIDIRLLVAEEHSNLNDRFLHALKFSLAYLEEHVGPYPYPSITVMDPPVHALRSGFMEYPMYITLGAFRYFPKGVRSIESLVVHEFAHQYFMAILASNEKEEAWLDEGFVTYYEDRIMEAMFDSEASLVEMGFVRINNRGLSRDEYTSLPDPAVVPPARPGWEIPESYKGLVYSKVASSLRTFENIIGRTWFDSIASTYFDKYRFTHPKGYHFLSVAESVLSRAGSPVTPEFARSFFNQTVYGSELCDFEVSGIFTQPNPRRVGWRGEGEDRTYFQEEDRGQGGNVIIRRFGGLVIPVDVRILFDDGSQLDTIWNPIEKRARWRFSKPVVTCVIDPDRKILLDQNLTNNAISLREDKKPLWTTSSQLAAWIQNVLQSLSFLI